MNGLRTATTVAELMSLLEAMPADGQLAMYCVDSVSGNNQRLTVEQASDGKVSLIAIGGQ